MANIICERCDQGFMTRKGLRCNILSPEAQQGVIQARHCDVGSHGRVEGILEYNEDGNIIFSSKNPAVSVIYFD